MTIHPTWDVAGLRATASNDTSLTDFAVDRRHTCSFADRPWADGPLWRLPLFVALAPPLAAVGLGVARGALDEINGQALARVAQMRGSLLDDHVGMGDLGAADALLRGARAGLLEASTSAGREPKSGIRSTGGSRPRHSSRRSTASTSRSRSPERATASVGAPRPTVRARCSAPSATSRPPASTPCSTEGCGRTWRASSPAATKPTHRSSCERGRARRPSATTSSARRRDRRGRGRARPRGGPRRVVDARPWARVGLHSSSLYQYFPSKLDIYDALFARWHRQLEAWMSSFDRDGDPEQVFRIGSARFTAFCMADPVRYQLLFQRTIPDFVPSEESMALARASFADMAAVLARLGVVDSADLDLWTAVQMGLADQQLANEPGGDRWTAQLDRAIDMFLAHVRPRRPRRAARSCDVERLAECRTPARRCDARGWATDAARMPYRGRRGVLLLL